MAMIVDYLKNKLDLNIDHLPEDVKRVMVKEILQSFILQYIYQHAEYRKLNFYGGSCARVVYGLDRLSEDIDLDNSEGVDLGGFEDDLERYFQSELQLRNTDIKKQFGEGGIARWTVKIPILYDLGLSDHVSEKLHIKVEVSSHEQHVVLKKTPVRHHGRGYVAWHFNKSSLMAGKMIACIERVYRKGRTKVQIKGRDFYDLLWYMQQQVVPYEKKLFYDGQERYSVKSAFEELSEKIRRIKVSDIEVHLRPTMVDQKFLDGWLESFADNFERYVEGYLG
jgi:hypothetical protein